MYNRILVPLDGSDYSEEVIAYAVGLSTASDTPLILLRAVAKESERSEATSYVENLAAERGGTGLCMVAGGATGGDVADVILAQAREVPGTLVVMTSRGRSGLMEAVLGSVALKVVRGANVPVMVYHPHGDVNKTEAKIEHVVLLLDGSERSQVMEEQAANFARWIGAELGVVSVINPKDMPRSGGPETGSMKAMESAYVRSRARRITDEYGIQANWETLYGEPVEAIADYLAGRRNVMLAMVTRGRPAIESAFLGSVTSGSLRRGGVPVLMRLP